MPRLVACAWFVRSLAQAKPEHGRKRPSKGRARACSSGFALQSRSPSGAWGGWVCAQGPDGSPLSCACLATVGCVLQRLTQHRLALSPSTWLRTGLKTCLWAVLALCVGNVFGSFTQSPLDVPLADCADTAQIHERAKERDAEILALDEWLDSTEIDVGSELLTHDPMGQFNNPYSYVGADPLSGVDPWGLEKVDGTVQVPGQTAQTTPGQNLPQIDPTGSFPTETPSVDMGQFAQRSGTSFVGFFDGLSYMLAVPIRNAYPVEGDQVVDENPRQYWTGVGFGTAANILLTSGMGIVPEGMAHGSNIMNVFRLGRVTRLSVPPPVQAPLNQAEASAVKRIWNTVTRIKPGPKGDVAGAVADQCGAPIPKPGGGFYDHTQEMNQIFRALRGGAAKLSKSTHPQAIAARRKALETLKVLEEAIRGVGL